PLELLDDALEFDLVLVVEHRERVVRLRDTHRSKPHQDGPQQPTEKASSIQRHESLLLIAVVPSVANCKIRISWSIAGLSGVRSGSRNCCRSSAYPPAQRAD